VLPRPATSVRRSSCRPSCTSSCTSWPAPRWARRRWRSHRGRTDNRHPQLHESRTSVRRSGGYRPARPLVRARREGHRPALGREQGSGDSALDTGRRELYGYFVGLSGRLGKTYPSCSQLRQLLGFTLGCRNSGENDRCPGRITKAGSSTARWLLA
jgi:hypothetical protein